MRARLTLVSPPRLKRLLVKTHLNWICSFVFGSASNSTHSWISAPKLGGLKPIPVAILCITGPTYHLSGIRTGNLLPVRWNPQDALWHFLLQLLLLTFSSDILLRCCDQPHNVILLWSRCKQRDSDKLLSFLSSLIDQRLIAVIRRVGPERLRPRRHTSKENLFY